MKLLPSLTSQPADNCIILTYNLDLLFFEYMLFSRLYANGCRNTIVICDPRQATQALADTAGLRYAGQRYWVVPARTSPVGAFHPKLILQTSENRGRVWLTSANLTKSGYTHNWEVATLIEFDVQRPDVAAWQACRWAYDMIATIVKASTQNAALTERVNLVLGTTPWLRNKPVLPDETETQVWCLNNLTTPLLDQIAEYVQQRDGSAIEDLIVVSPFFDHGSHAFRQTFERWQPRRMQVYTQGVDNGLNPQSLQTWLAQYRPTFSLARVDWEPRHLHAKSILLRTRQGAWLFTGSANFSAPALLKPAATGNTELGILRYARDPAYFDAWLAELAACSSSLDVTTLSPLHSVDPMDNSDQPSMALLQAATLAGNSLTLYLTQTLPLDAKLTLYRNHEHAPFLSVTTWQQSPQKVVKLLLPDKSVRLFEQPAHITLEVTSEEHKDISTPVLVHQLDELERFGRPFARKQHSTFAPGLVPQDYEHCAQLMDTLHNLLATNKAQLSRHQDHIAALRKRDHQEEQMAIEEQGDYDPETHIVPETVRAIGLQEPGASLYADYFERLTYEEILRAALAAVYAPLHDHHPPESGAKLDPDATPQIPSDEALRTKTLARIQSGFRRLVQNFVHGLNDPGYLGDVPKKYLLELFMIITTFLRELWRHEMLPNEMVIEHSQTLFSAFWGKLGEQGAWQMLQALSNVDELAQEEQRLKLAAQTWLHVYIVADLLNDKNDRRRYDLAAWIRYFTPLYSPENTLGTLDDTVYSRIWRFSWPPACPCEPATDVIFWLNFMADLYDEANLLDELSHWPGTHARVSQQNISRHPKLPALEVKTPLTEQAYDPYLRAFLLFICWPHPKEYAWAVFTNTNPLINDEDIASVRFLYEAANNELTFAVRNKIGNFTIDMVRHIDKASLHTLKSIEQLQSLTPP